MFHDMRSAIIYAGQRYGFSDPVLFSVVSDVKRSLEGAIGNFIDDGWPPGQRLPAEGFVTRFDAITPWLIREAFENRGPRPGWRGADMQLDVSKVAGWANSLQLDPDALLDKLDMMDWKDAVQAASKWYVRVTRGMVPRVPLSETAVLTRFPDGSSIERLTRAMDFDGEGLSMDHCLRQILHYYDDVLHGVCVLMSYRDPDGVPQVTWELNIDHGLPRMVQLQGPRNGPIGDADARDRVAWFLGSYLDMTANDNLTGMWAERIGLEERQAPRSWSRGSRLPSSSGAIPLSGGWELTERPPDSDRHSVPTYDYDDHDDELAWETEALLDDLSYLEGRLNKWAAAAKSAAETGDKEYLELSLERAKEYTNDWLLLCASPSLIEAVWEAPSVTEPDIEAWEVLDNAQSIWLVRLSWERDRGLLSWGAELIDSSGAGSFRSQHMNSPREALESAGLDLSIDDLIEDGEPPKEEGWYEDPSDDIFELRPVKDQAPSRQTALVPTSLSPKAPELRELPQDRERMMEDLTRMIDDIDVGSQRGEDAPFDPEEAISRGGHGSDPKRTPQECVSAHAVYVSNFPLTG